MFPIIKYKDCDEKLIKKLKLDLITLKESILGYSPSDFNKGKLDRIRIRVFKFSRKETCNEFFIISGNKKYVCLNASFLKRRYYAALQHLLHGISHRFSHFRDEIADEIFCEFVSYSLLDELLEKRGKEFRGRILKSIERESPKEYNYYYKMARKLNKMEDRVLLRMNNKIKNRKISKKNEKMFFKKFLKKNTNVSEELVEDLPELERDFKVL
ncbi:MAG: hypothetical protein GF368_05145 [Candidatus Aenigmarchaeota archaeon]|nr:hypothetical protein [Candidatus Aenigmarchaeota archaeon]